jgi:hypothetical protein
VAAIGVQRFEEWEWVGLGLVGTWAAAKGIALVAGVIDPQIVANKPFVVASATGDAGWRTDSGCTPSTRPSGVPQDAFCTISQCLDVFVVQRQK